MDLNSEVITPPLKLNYDPKLMEDTQFNTHSGHFNLEFFEQENWYSIENIS